MSDYKSKPLTPEQKAFYESLPKLHPPVFSIEERMELTERLAVASVLRIRCTKHLSVPQQNSNEHTGAECGGCIAEQLTTALARAERAENERDELKRQFTDWRYSHDEIEASCGGELALDVRDKVIKRRAKILGEGQMAGQILTPTSRSKKFFNDCADRIETLETRNRQLVQAMGEAVKRINDNTEQVQNDKFDGRFKDGHAVAASMAIAHIEAALAPLKEMGKE